MPSPIPNNYTVRFVSATGSTVSAHDPTTVHADGDGVGWGFNVTGGSGQGLTRRVSAAHWTPDGSGGSDVVFTLETLPGEDLANTLSDSTAFWLTPILTGCARGALGTTAIDHQNFQAATYYSPNVVGLNRFEYYTTEIDMSFEHMVMDMARKAGVHNLTSEKLMNGTLTTTSLDTVLTSAVDKANFIVNFRPDSALSPRFGMIRTNADKTLGYAVRVDAANNVVGIYKYPGWTFVENIPIQDSTGWTTISWFNGFLSIWMEGRLINTWYFPDLDVETGKAAAFSDGSGTVTVDWPVLDMRIDNYILDSGRSALDLLDSLIKERIIYYRDAQDGSLYIYRNRYQIPGTFNMTISGALMDTDANVVSRIRAEGIDVVEQADFSLMKEFGNIFMLQQLYYPNNTAEMLEEVGYQLAEANRLAGTVTLTGIPDLRFEPDDMVNVYLPDGTANFIIDSTNYMVDFTGGKPTFDMNLEGHDA